MFPGAGEMGNYCFMDDQCRPGLHCSSWEKDINICMGHGQRHDPCNSDFDCDMASCMAEGQSMTKSMNIGKGRCN